MEGGAPPKMMEPGDESISSSNSDGVEHICSSRTLAQLPGDIQFIFYF